MAQTAPKLHLVTTRTASTGYARDAWFSHVIETCAGRISGVELAVLGELLRQVHDADGWAEVSYERLARRTFFAVKTVRNAVRKLKELGLVAPELVGKRRSPTGQGRDRLRYHFPAMHAFLAGRRARRAGAPGAARDPGRGDHGTSDHGTRPRPTLVSRGRNSPPLKNQESEPDAHAREEPDLEETQRRLAHEAPPLARALDGCSLELAGRELRVWMPPRLEAVLRASEGRLRDALQRCGLGDLRLGRLSERPRGSDARA
jgi:hypothetical protein